MEEQGTTKAKDVLTHTQSEMMGSSSHTINRCSKLDHIGIWKGSTGFQTTCEDNEICSGSERVELDSFLLQTPHTRSKWHKFFLRSHQKPSRADEPNTTRILVLDWLPGYCADVVKKILRSRDFEETAPFSGTNLCAFQTAFCAPGVGGRTAGTCCCCNSCGLNKMKRSSSFQVHEGQKRGWPLWYTVQYTLLQAGLASHVRQTSRRNRHKSSRIGFEFIVPNFQNGERMSLHGCCDNTQAVLQPPGTGNKPTENGQR